MGQCDSTLIQLLNYVQHFNQLVVVVVGGWGGGGGAV